MKALKLYCVIVFVLLVSSGVSGFLLPSLLSAKSDESVLAGVGIVILMPIGVYLLWHVLSKASTKRDDKNDR